MSYEMQPDPGPTPPPRHRPRGDVLGMSASISFSAGSVVMVNVLIEQDSTPDNSTAYSAAAGTFVTGNPLPPLTLTSLTGSVPYTTGQDFSLNSNLDNDGANFRMLAAFVSHQDITVGESVEVSLIDANALEALPGTVTFQSTGTADIQLDLEGDTGLGTGRVHVSLSAGSGGSPVTANVSLIEGTASYTEGETFRVVVDYRDANDDLVEYAGRVLAQDVVEGDTVPLTLTKQS